MRTRAPVAPALLLALAAACSDDSPMGAPNADSAPASLAIALATDSISPGKSVQLAATLTDADGRTSSCDACTWSSSDATVAAVSSTGRLTWIKAGTAAITVTRGGTSATDTVTVFEGQTPPTQPSLAVAGGSAGTGGGVGIAVHPGEDIQARVSSAPTGSVFTLKAGTHYLQAIAPKDGMTFVGEAGTVLSGARRLTTFVRQGRFWVATGQTQQGKRILGRPNGKPICEPSYPRCGYPEALFIDNRQLKHVGNLSGVGPGKWYFDYGANKIYFADNPSGRKVETSVLPNAFKGGASNVTVRGFIIEKYATPLQQATVHGGTGWRIENNEVRYNGGIGIFTGSRTRALRNKVHHNRQLGMGGTGDGALIEGNVISYNNPGIMAYGWAAGGTKWYGTRNLVVRGNFVHHNDGPGIWTDIDNIYALIERNRVEDNSRNGIFHEIGYNAVIRYNTCARNGFAMPSRLRGGGIAVTSSPNVEIYGNTLVNNNEGFAINQDNRGSGRYGLYEVRNLHVHNNTVSLGRGQTGLGTSGSISYYSSKNNRFRGNTYRFGSNPRPFWWKNGSRTYAEWRAFGQQ